MNLSPCDGYNASSQLHTRHSNYNTSDAGSTKAQQAEEHERQVVQGVLKHNKQRSRRGRWCREYLSTTSRGAGVGERLCSCDVRFNKN